MTEDPWQYFKMSTAPMSNSCQKTLTFCQEGHEMERCQTRDKQDGLYCKQCNDYSFQPNQNRLGDRCRLRRVCDKAFMKYLKYGSKIKDAECQCEVGFHFESEDQRACVPNKVCPKGFGQGPFGRCEDCGLKNMWSDKSDRNQKCRALRNCEKESRCTTRKSDGTFDNSCGPTVSDVNDCESIISQQNDGDGMKLSDGVLVGIIVGAFIVLVLVIVALFCIIKKRRQASGGARRMTKDELEELLQEIIKRSRKDENYCRKVLTTAQREVEDRIDRQIWRLPQELFRNHIEPAKYEVTVEKYKGHQHKFAINGYMQDWRSWKGDTSEAVEELVRCLKHVEREDIVYEIVNKLSDEYQNVSDWNPSSNKRSTKPGTFERFWSTLFCVESNTSKPTDTYESKETSSKLLEAQTPPESVTYHVTPENMPPSDAGALYRSRQTPSAPVIEPDFYPDGSRIPEHFYDRSDSVPVQASS